MLPACGVRGVIAFVLPRSASSDRVGDYTATGRVCLAGLQESGEMPSSAARKNLISGMKSVDNVLSFAKTGQGKPSAAERSLFVASVALSYAVWENFAEDLAVESVTFVAQKLDPARVPEAARKFIERNNTSPWQLAVHPGWRELWVERLREEAKGRVDEERSFGLLTADTKGVRRIFGYIGLDPFKGAEDSDTDSLDDLVRLRGEIVHTGQAPKGFLKSDATGSETVVKTVAESIDQSVGKQIQELVGQAPW